MRRKRYYKKRYKKRGRGIPYVYNNRIYFEEKNTKRDWNSFKSTWIPFKKRWRHYWILMVKKKYIWYINRKKSKKKNKRKYKTKRGKGFGDGFKLLYSLGKQCRSSMQ